MTTSHSYTLEPFSPSGGARPHQARGNADKPWCARNAAVRTALAAIFVAFAHAALAQQPPKPNDSPRAVTLSLAEYNRLIDLASRPSAAPAPAPVAAVLSSADLRVRVERDTARGAFTLTGDVLREGVSRVSLMAGATLLEANVSGRPLPPGADGNRAAAREARTLADVMTLVTLGDSDVRMVALIDLTVVQGEPRSVDVRLPSGYELTGVSGSSLESSERHDGTVLLTIGDPVLRRHQF